MKASGRVLRCAQRGKKLLLCVALCAAGGALCLGSGIVREAVYGALTLCVRSVVPALFPFLILNALWVESGLAARLSWMLRGAASALLGVGCCSTPLLLGLIGGYPVGAGCIGAMARRGECTREEGERMLCFCCNTGPSFLAVGVGGAMLGSVRAGWLLYGAQVLSALCTGVLLRVLLGRVEGAPGTVRPPALRWDAALPVRAVSDAAPAMLKICGFAAAFGVLPALLGAAGEGLGHPLSPLGRALLTGFFEVSGGCAAAAGLGGRAALTLCGCLCGWGGVSVHLQCRAALEGSGLRMRGFAAVRLLQSALCGLFCLLLCKFF